MNSRGINTLLAAALAFSVFAATQASAASSFNGWSNGLTNGWYNGLTNGWYNGLTNGSFNGVKSGQSGAIGGYGLRVTGIEYLPGAVVK